MSNFLGRGGFGSVYERMHENYGQVAVKEVYYGGNNNEVMREVAILCRLTANQCCRDYIIKLYEYIDKPLEGKLFIVMEYVKGVPVFIRNLDEWIALADFLINAVRCIHKCGVVHRDIKIENVLRTQDGTFKLIDFGLSCFLGDNETEYKCKDEVLGTVEYFSPELIMAPEYLSTNDIMKASDYWAVGILLYRLWYKESPYPTNYHLDRMDLMDMIADLTEIELGPAPNEVIDILSDLLTIEPELRLEYVEEL